ncbi:MAG: LPS core biosynthesis protein, partial [Deltaproteobacteria bacterium]|nr:LPS core biosynthesis protein [Deltaproteobacteria bacterium]
MKNSPLLSKAPKKILLITTRRIGDVFLTAPLIASLREAYPDAKIDMLVFKGTEGAVFANSALSRIVTVEEGAALP